MSIEKKGTFVLDPSVNWIQHHWGEEVPNAIAECSFIRIPFDLCVSYRPGARFGPNSIISALNNYSLFCMDKCTDLSRFKFIDYGPVDISNSITESHDHIQRAIYTLPENNIPFILGGDHSITEPILRAISSRGNSEFATFVFDSHLDSRPKIPGNEHSGNWMNSIENIHYDFSLITQIGLSSSIYSQYYYDYALEKGINLVTSYDIRREGIEQILAQLYNKYKNIGSCYISIDIDVIDWAFAEGTSVPNPCGLFPHHIYDMVYNIASKFDILGIDIVEVSPPLDNKENKTSHIAAQIILNTLAGMVKK